MSVRAYVDRDTRWQRAVGSRAALRSGLCFFWEAGVIKTSIYVDGFNLYYGALKGSPYKWLDVVAVSKRLLPAHAQVAKVKYFTARVSGAADPDAPRRQQIYLSALATLPEVEIHYGRFLAKTIWRPHANIPIAGAQIACNPPATLPLGTHAVLGGVVPSAKSLVVGDHSFKGAGGKRRKTPRPLSDALITEVHTMEEKGSDVNLAAHLLNDAWKGQFDAAVVISNDTDLITPIQMVSVERGKPVFVVCPGKWAMAPGLERVATHKRHVHSAMLHAAQFPQVIPGTTTTKPATW